MQSIRLDLLKTAQLTCRDVTDKDIDRLSMDCMQSVFSPIHHLSTDSPSTSSCLGTEQTNCVLTSGAFSKKTSNNGSAKNSDGIKHISNITGRDLFHI